MMRVKNRKEYLEILLKDICKTCSVDTEEVLTSKRNNHVCTPRHVYMYVASTKMGFGFEDIIGDIVGRAPGAVRYGKRTVQDCLDVTPSSLMGALATHFMESFPSYELAIGPTPSFGDTVLVDNEVAVITRESNEAGKLRVSTKTEDKWILLGDIHQPK